MIFDGVITISPSCPRVGYLRGLGIKYFRPVRESILDAQQGRGLAGWLNAGCTGKLGRGELLLDTNRGVSRSVVLGAGKNIRLPVGSICGRRSRWQPLTEIERTVIAVANNAVYPFFQCNIVATRGKVSFSRNGPYR